MKKLNLYIDYAKHLDDEKHPWAERVSFQAFSLKDLNQITQVLDEIPEEAEKLVTGLQEIVGQEATYHDARTISENLDKLKEFNVFLKNKEIYALFKPMVAFSNQETELLWLSNSRNLINACFSEGVEQHVRKEIGDIQVILKQRLDAKSTFWNSIKWNFSKEKTRLARVLVANQLRDDEQGLKTLTERIDNRLNVKHQLTKLRAVGWITDCHVLLTRMN